LAFADAKREFSLATGWVEEVAPTVAGRPIKKASYTGAVTMKALAGCRLLSTTMANPRKIGTIGWRSMQIIIQRPEIILEAYLAMGGRMNDLRWDLERGHVVVIKE
jgi:hypothetical protein